MSADDKNRLVAQLAVKQTERLRRFLRRRVRNAADIPDIMQEVFLRLLRVPSHESIRSPEAYLFTIARHVAQQHKLQMDPTQECSNLEDVLVELRSFSNADPVLDLAADQCLEEMDKALGHMPPKMQATFLLHRRDGLTMDQVSERLGISRAMAKKYLVKAFTQFRKRLQEDE